MRPDESGARLDKFLAHADRLQSRGRATAALDRGKVYVNGAVVDRAAASTALAAGDLVRVWMDKPGSATAPLRAGRRGDLEIVFEDDLLIVVNKPAGLLSVPLERKGDAASVFTQVEQHLRPHGRRRPLVVHRIDQDTSGLVLFAKDSRAQLALLDQFKRRQPERHYRAVVDGHPDPPAGVWTDWIVWDPKALIQKPARPGARGASEAISEYRMVERFAAAALLEVRLVSGRRNQIRIQAQLRGHPLVGEKRYVRETGAGPIRAARHALHGWRLALRHPEDNRPLAFEAPEPRDFVDLVERLRREAGSRVSIAKP